MANKKFSYEDPRHLNTLVNYIEGKNCKLSATLMPDIPAFIDIVYRNNFFSKSSGVIDYSLLKGFDPASVQMHTFLVLKLCEEHHIMPFWNMIFDGGWQKPEIKYVGPSGFSVDAEPYKTCAHPAWFMQNRKWYQLLFEDYQGEENVEAAKEAIAGAIEKGYVVTRLSASLNPRIRTADHYCDYEVNDGTLFAYDGTIEISGVPEDFEFPKDPVKIERQRKSLLSFTQGFLSHEKKD